ncbi:DUF4421 family protein [Chitinophaga lutea]
MSSLLIGLATMGLLASGSDTSRPRERWVGKTDSLLTIRLTQRSDLEQLSAESDDLDIDISPNARSLTQLSLSYRFITVSASVAPKFFSSNRDEALKGKTKSRGLGAGFNFRHWQQELSYHRTQGFYLENTGDLQPNWREGMPYIQFPLLTLTTFQGATAYNFNPRFSVNAVLTQSERQLRSAGSFIPVLTYRFYVVNDRSAPTSVNNATQRSDNFELVLGAGYQHTFVYRNLYFSLGATPGFGYLFTKLSTRFADDTYYYRYNNPAWRLDMRAGLGYNGPRFFAGAYLSAIATTSEQPHTAVTNGNTQAAFRIFAGYRLKAPGILVKAVGMIDEKRASFRKKK